MKDIFKQYNNEKMTAEEKQSVLNEINIFIKQNPTKTPWYTTLENKIISPFQDGLLLHHKMLASAFVIIILVSATGGTSIAARYSVPGDILYPVKINLNEKMGTFTAVSPEAKATVEAQHINERLSEAEKLSTENKLSETIKTQLESKFSLDLQNTMAHVEKLNSNGDSKKADQVKADIEKSLQKHKEMVDKILENSRSRSGRSLQKTSTKMRPEATRVTTPMSAFSAEISTSTATTSSVNQEMNYDQIEKESKDNKENKTPLLDETLKKILEAREEKED